MKTKITTGLFGFIALLAAGMASAATVQFTAGSVAAAQGTPLASSFTLTVEGTGFTQTTVGGGFLLSWDSSVVNLLSGLGNNSAVAGSVAASAASHGFDIASASIPNPLPPQCTGTISCIDVSVTSFLNTFSGNFTIADLVFEATAPGASVLDLNFGIIDAVWYATDFFTPLASQPTFIGATVTVGAVPVPPAVWLFGSGLLGLIGVARRRTTA